MRYMVAVMFALAGFVMTLGLVAAIFGQAFDGVDGAWGYVPLAGELILGGAAAICGFRLVIPAQSKQALREPSGK
jgi:hypothetical protein